MRTRQASNGSVAREISPVLGGLLLAACSLTLDAERQQCLTDEDCVRASPTETLCVANVCTAPRIVSADDGGEDGGVMDPKWGCIGRTQPVPVEPSTPVRFQWNFVAPLKNGAPWVGVKYKACESLDTACSSPLPGTEGETDATGLLDTTLYKGFRGFFDLTGADGSGLQPAIFVVNPLDGDTVGGKLETQAPLFTEAEFQVLTQSLGKAASAEYGHILGLVVDCEGVEPAAGITIEATKVTAETYRYYSDQNRVPSLELTSTTTRGEAGYVNLPPGSVTINYFRNGAPLGSITTIVRARTISLITMRPQ